MESNDKHEIRGELTEEILEAMRHVDASGRPAPIPLDAMIEREKAKRDDKIQNS